MKMDKGEGKKHVEKAMEAIRKDPFIQKYVSNEMKCLKCENTVFQVKRMAPFQVLLTCDSCGERYLVDAQLDEERVVLTFWGSKMEELKT